jgi:hypothetical protein
MTGKRLTDAEAREREERMLAAELKTRRAGTKTALEAMKEAAAKAGITMDVIEPEQGSGTVTFLRKREEELLEDDDGSGAVE